MALEMHLPKCLLFRQFVVETTNTNLKLPGALQL
jgi:hypothetical protein